MPITVGDIVNALEALGGEAHYSEITDQILKVAQGPFPEDPQASVRARLQERCSDYKAYKGQLDLFESEQGTGIWRFRINRQAADNSSVNEERDVYDATEGKLVPKTHFIRERDPKLIAKFKASLTDPRCEACAMNFSEVYGALGANYIEAHHNNPIALMAEGETTSLEDLAALCSNCHRVIHKNFPMSVKQLAEVLNMPGGHADLLSTVQKTRQTWKEAVQAAILRRVAAKGSPEFSRTDIIENELSMIVEDVGSKGDTPEQTLSRVLQELRQAEVIEFLDNQGSYRLK